MSLMKTMHLQQDLLVGIAIAMAERVIYFVGRVSRVLRMLPNEAVSAVAQFAEGLMGGIASAIAGATQSDGAALNGTEV